jgi:hypothetical protein
MPIRCFLPGQAFDQDAIEAMSEAFIDACKKLGLADVDDPMTRLVARHIIELAQRGIWAKTALYFRTLEEFRAKARPEAGTGQVGGYVPSHASAGRFTPDPLGRRLPFFCSRPRPV